MRLMAEASAVCFAFISSGTSNNSGTCETVFSDGTEGLSAVVSALAVSAPFSLLLLAQFPAQGVSDRATANCIGTSSAGPVGTGGLIRECAT